MILEDIRREINEQIQNVQIKKQELFDKISKFDSELLDLNETLVKINDEDAFLKITPIEAFSILEKIGYKNQNEIADLYIDIICSSKNKNINNHDIEDYIEEIDNSTQDNYQTILVKRKQIKKIMNILDNYFENDDCYYFIKNVKLSKFRIFYNMLNLIDKNIEIENIMRFINTSFCYKNVFKEDKGIVLEEISNANINLEKIYKEIKIIKK